MAGPDPFKMQASLKGSPASVLTDRIGAELAAGAIACACPHPATADRLYLPSRTLPCHDCSAEAGDRPDGAPGTCTSCGAVGACNWSGWVDKQTRVLVVARVCEPCGTDGTVPLCLN